MSLHCAYIHASEYTGCLNKHDNISNYFLRYLFQIFNTFFVEHAVKSGLQLQRQTQQQNLINFSFYS